MYAKTDVICNDGKMDTKQRCWTKSIRSITKHGE